MTMSDTSRHLLEDALCAAEGDRLAVHVRIVALEPELRDLRVQRFELEERIAHLRADLGIRTEPADPDEPVPFEVVDDPWAVQS